MNFIEDLYCLEFSTIGAGFAALNHLAALGFADHDTSAINLAGSSARENSRGIQLLENSPQPRGGYMILAAARRDRRDEMSLLTERLETSAWCRIESPKKFFVQSLFGLQDREDATLEALLIIEDGPLARVIEDTHNLVNELNLYVIELNKGRGTSGYAYCLLGGPKDSVQRATDNYKGKLKIRVIDNVRASMRAALYL